VLVRAFGGWLPLPQLVALLNDSFADHPGHVTWNLAQLMHAHARPDFDPSVTTLVSPADRPDDPIAFLQVGMRPAEGSDPAPVGEVRLLGVLSEWRGRGLGRELPRAGVAEVRARGAGRVKLAVEAGNERALSLYRRTGFEPVVGWPHWTYPVAAGAGAVSPR
jgi:mycothiol synthase